MSKVFALVPKQVNNPFFDVVRNGCVDEANKLGVECRYVGPEEANAEDQFQIVQQLVQEGEVHGIALSVIDAESAAESIEIAHQAGIPVVTFDSDSPNSKRIGYIGTNNYALGRSLGKVLLQLNPEGGSYGIISDSAPNIMTRVEGVRSYLEGSAWREVEEEPRFSLDSIDVSLQHMWDLAAIPGIKAIVPVGGWPMFDSNSTRWRQFVDAHRNLTLVSADTLPVQVDLLTNDYVDGLVGQVPYQMGVECIRILDQYPVVPKTEILGTSVMEFVRVPLLLPDPEIDQNLLGHLSIVGFVVFGIIAATAMIMMGWTIWSRQLIVIRASQPLFLVMVGVGTILMGSSLIPLSFDDSKGTAVIDDHVQERLICMSVPWLLSLGFTITFSALFSKTWRVNKIFHGSQSGFGKFRVTERDVMVPFLVLLACNVIVLVVWTLVSPMEYTRLPHEGTDGWNRVISTYGSCRSTNGGAWPYTTVLGIINLGILGIANWQAYEARSIQSEFSESRYIGIVMASLLQACVSGFPILFLVRELPQAFYLVMVSMVFVMCMAILLLVFVPKMLAARRLHHQPASRSRSQLQEAIRQSMLPGASNNHQLVQRSYLESTMQGSGGSDQFNSSFSNERKRLVKMAEGPEGYDEEDCSPDDSISFRVLTKNKELPVVSEGTTLHEGSEGHSESNPILPSRENDDDDDDDDDESRPKE